MGRYELNKLTSLPMCGFIAQLVEHRTGIAEVTGSNPVEALIFFRLLLSSCLNWKIHCEDHSSLSLVNIFVRDGEKHGVRYEAAESFKDEACSTLVVLNCLSLSICVLCCFYSRRLKPI